MFLLSYVLCGTYAIVLIPYAWEKYRLKNGHIISLSGMICNFKPLGHFFMSLGNLMMFEIMTLEHKEIAWVYWCALQLVLCFDIDDHENWHFFWLLIYIAMLCLFWGVVCQQHDFWVQASALWVTTGVFSLVWLYNMLMGTYQQKKTRVIDLPLLETRGASKQEVWWPRNSEQSVAELLWIASLLVTTFLYEKMLREEKGLTSDSYGI
jgi:hypothetical protein